MPEVKDLGLANNEIVSVTRTSGTGQPGSVDTYTIAVRDGTTFTFNVTNGNNGLSGLSRQEFTDMAAFTTFLDSNKAKIACIVYRYLDGNSINHYHNVVFGLGSDALAESTKFLKYMDNSGNWQSITALSENNELSVYYFENAAGVAVVPTSRTIAGLGLESDITENALFDKMNVKGKYATLSALQTASPSHDYCYLVEENNHWYYWNGSAWADGGLYQAPTLPYKVSGRIAEVKDLFDNLIYVEDDFTSGYSYNSTGTLEASDSSIYLPPIDISNYLGGNIKIIQKSAMTQSSRFTLISNYDDSIKNFYANAERLFDGQINEEGYYETNIPIKENYKYLRASFRKNSLVAFIIEKPLQNDKKTFLTLQNRRREIALNFKGRGSSRMSTDYFLVSSGDFEQIELTGIPENMGVSFFYYATQGGSEQNTGWNYVSEYSVSCSGYYLIRFEFRKQDNTVFTDTEFGGLINSVKFYQLLPDEIMDDTVYVDGAKGSDTNVGNSSHPFKTITQAISSGAKNIKVKPGEYTERVQIVNKSGIRISTYGMATFSASVPDTPMIKITGGSGKTISNALYITGCTDIIIENVWCDSTSADGAYISNSSRIVMNNCKFTNTFNNGLALLYVNGVFNDCVAHDIGDASLVHADGFNIHGYGDTIFNNCVAYNCLDDGISHHDGCTGFINGGEFYNCGKGGIASPTHGALINITGAYCHNNYAGIYSSSDSDSIRTGNILITNCVLKNNSYDIVVSRYTLNMLNCVYSKTSVGTGGVINNLNS